MRFTFTCTFTCLLVFLAVSIFAQPKWQAAKGPLTTPWTAEVSPENVLPEYPRPQMKREKWLNLNGEWNFQLMNLENEAIVKKGKILVPFPVESALSGIAHKVEPKHLMVYNRSFSVPADWRGQRILLHFGAVDWETEVFVNTQKVGDHKGGYDAFSFDITDHLKPGSGPQQVTVQVKDPTDSGGQAIGKQRLDPHGIWYTASSGIWQTVWLEPVPQTYIRSIRIEPDMDKKRVVVRVDLEGENKSKTKVTARILEDGSKLSESTGMTAGTPLLLNIRKNARLWSPTDPYLYDLEVSLPASAGGDVVSGYFGLRKVSLGQDDQGFTRLLLNNEPLFQLGPLDQGFFPDGLYTPPAEAAMEYDLKVLKDMGFNMIRKHVKVEPARWYHLCDKMGILVWQDMPSAANKTKEDQRQFRYELKAMVDGLFNHPSVVIWVPFNEGWGQHDTETYVEKLKEWDPTRLVINASGWTDKGVGDVLDIHAYPGPAVPDPQPDRATVLGEFGGLGLNVAGHKWTDEGWGYEMISTPDELLYQYEELFRRLHSMAASAGLSAAVYTQVSDIETENNGLMTYDRKVIKLDPGLIALAHSGHLPPKPQNNARIFIKKGYLQLQTIKPGAAIFYSFDNNNPESVWKKYDSPVMLKRSGPVYCKAEWPDGKESHVQEYIYEKVKPLKSKAPKEMTAGASLKVYEGVWDNLPDFRTLSITEELTVNELGLSEIKMTRHFALQFAGYLEVPETGVYSFHVSSDDGSRLVVAGQTIIENDGLHGMRGKTGSLALKKGTHPFQLAFFQKEGGQGLEVWMEDASGERQPLRLYQKKKTT